MRDDSYWNEDNNGKAGAEDLSETYDDIASMDDSVFDWKESDGSGPYPQDAAYADGQQYDTYYEYDDGVQDSASQDGGWDDRQDGPYYDSYGSYGDQGTYGDSISGFPGWTWSYVRSRASTVIALTSIGWALGFFALGIIGFILNCVSLSMVCKVPRELQTPGMRVCKVLNIISIVLAAVIMILFVIFIAIFMSSGSPMQMA